MRRNRDQRSWDHAERRRARAAVERVESPSSRRVLRQYLRWLEEERHLASSAIEAPIHLAVFLLESWVPTRDTCVRALRRLRSRDVERLIRRRQRQLAGKPVASRKFRCGLALFLRYCVARGWHRPALLVQAGLRPKTFWDPEAPRHRTGDGIERVRSNSARRVLGDYALWLEEHEGLAVSTIEGLVRVARVALSHWLKGRAPCVATLRRLTVQDVEMLLVRRHQAGARREARRGLERGVRRFLRFCVARRWIGPRLLAGVPRSRRYRLSSVPRGVSKADFPALVEALSFAESSWPKRDRAIALLLITYGVRRAQVADLRLEDLDWTQKRVRFRAHKGGRPVQHSLTPAVAEGLAEYLIERPDCAIDQVFLRAGCLPRRASPDVVSQVVRRLFETAGVQAGPRGPHALRHAFAQRVLDARMSYKTVADLLGHRSLETTAIYAKVDAVRLREAALEWPEVLR